MCFYQHFLGTIVKSTSLLSSKLHWLPPAHFCCLKMTGLYLHTSLAWYQLTQVCGGGLASFCYSLELGCAPLNLKQAELEQPYGPDTSCDELPLQACCVYCPPGSFCCTMIGGWLSRGGRIRKLVCLDVTQQAFLLVLYPSEWGEELKNVLPGPSLKPRVA